MSTSSEYFDQMVEGRTYPNRVSSSSDSQAKPSLADRLAQLAGDVHRVAKEALYQPTIPADSKLGRFMADNPEVKIKFQYI